MFVTLIIVDNTVSRKIGDEGSAVIGVHGFNLKGEQWTQFDGSEWVG
jgi:hypothetical protein